MSKIKQFSQFIYLLTSETPIGLRKYLLKPYSFYIVTLNLGVEKLVWRATECRKSTDLFRFHLLAHFEETNRIKKVFVETMFIYGKC